MIALSTQATPTSAGGSERFQAVGPVELAVLAVVLGLGLYVAWKVTKFVVKAALVVLVLLLIGGCLWWWSGGGH